MKVNYVPTQHIIPADDFAAYSRSTGTDGWQAIYLAAEVDARIADVREKHEAQILEVTALVGSRDARIVELEKALRDVSLIDLGFQRPRWYCVGCVSYGNSSDSIAHKDGCVVAKTLSL